MFDFSFSELILASVIALVVLGPERLPKAARQIGIWIGKAKAMTANLQNELSRQADLAELQKMREEFNQTAENLRGEIRQVTGSLPAWETLPEQRTPADFGVDDNGTPLPTFHNETSSTFLLKSLHKQAMARKRDQRPRHRPRPRLRSRK